MHYLISIADPQNHFVSLCFTINAIHQDTIHLQLPSWRPGRYELQNYAKNVRKFDVRDRQGNPLPYAKTSKDRWEIQTGKTDQIEVRYEYYANQPDAGASFVNEELLYLNPVNCMMYMEGRMDEDYLIEFVLPDNWQLASQMKRSGRHQLTAPGFDYLADSPLFASPHLQHHSFTINEGANTLNFWFHGQHPIDILRLENDTRAYAEIQTSLFGDMPSGHYHFMYLMLPQPFRHGVEHLDSTVIAMGQYPDSTDEEFYHDLLAISCHELFHLWNIKRIRPADMLPYDFTKENYSTLGYVYEGVTTYYGDLLLRRSGVWNDHQYLFSLSQDLKKHFANTGRFYASLAESSWDTWLDGYVPGVAGRKVSIYTEGLIAAWIADLMIVHHSKGKYRLDHVMRELYQHDFKHGSGYHEARYRALLEQFAGVSFQHYFDELIYGKGHWDKWLNWVSEITGCSINPDESQEGRIISVASGNNSNSNPEIFQTWLNS